MKNNKLTEQVYLYLLEKIETGSLQVGTKLVEEELVAKLGVSRSPIRKAFQRLTSEGHLQMVPYKGVTVQERPLSQQAYVERLEVLELLLNQYLFQVEAKNIVLPLAELQAQLALIEQTLAAGETAQVIPLEIELMKGLLQGQKNRYYQGIILESTKELLTTYARVVPRSQEELVQQYYQCFRQVIAFIADKKYPHGRREIRIFINTVTLAVIDRQELEGQDKYSLDI